jgi:hypothetical protein
MTPIEIIFAIREKLKEYVDDTRYTDQFLMKLIDLKRSVLIRQQYNQIQRSVDYQLEQLITLAVSEVDGSDSNSIPIFDTDLIRTTKAIPKVLELHHRNLLQRVATLGKLDKPMNYVSMRRFIYIGGDQFEHDAIYYTMDEAGYIYIKSKQGEEINYENISVRAIFESPLEVYEFIPSQSLETFQYPCGIHMLDTVINMIVQELASFKTLPTDEENNSADDATILKGKISG